MLRTDCFMDLPVTAKFRAQFMRNSRYLLIVALLASVCPVAAHDFWIEPTVFRPKLGTSVGLRLFVGQDFKGDSVPYFPQKFERYVVAGPAGTQPIPGVLGDEPSGTVIPAAAGLYVVGLHTKPDSVSFDTPGEFEQYLRKEGLERNLALHQQRQNPEKKSTKPIFAAPSRSSRRARPGTMRIAPSAFRWNSLPKPIPTAHLRCACACCIGANRYPMHWWSRSTRPIRSPSSRRAPMTTAEWNSACRARVPGS